MKQFVYGIGLAVMLAGCAFNPESLPLGEKDSMVYVDEGAPKTLEKKETKFKVAVITSAGDYKALKKVTEALDSSFNAKLAALSFFQVFDRTIQAALIEDALKSGNDASEIPLSGVEADFVVVARVASFTAEKKDYTYTPKQKKNAPPAQPQTSTQYTAQIVLDFKWIDKATQRVVMTESYRPQIGATSSEVALVDAIGRAAENSARDFCAKIGVKYAPPARVLQTRGNGAAARISLGKNYGVGEGTPVCFYEIVDNSDVGGAKRDMNDIATGIARRVEEKTSWVEVDNAEKVNVRKGVYVRLLEKKAGPVFGSF